MPKFYKKIKRRRIMIGAPPSPQGLARCYTFCPFLNLCCECAWVYHIWRVARIRQHQHFFLDRAFWCWWHIRCFFEKNNLHISKKTAMLFFSETHFLPDFLLRSSSSSPPPSSKGSCSILINYKSCKIVFTNRTEFLGVFLKVNFFTSGTTKGAFFVCSCFCFCFLTSRTTRQVHLDARHVFPSSPGSGPYLLGSDQVRW